MTTDAAAAGTTAADISPVTGPLPREARVEVIRSLLQTAFAPSALEVIDDSHRHVGHEGAKDGRGHFTVRLVSPAFAGMAPLARHRAVYAVLDDLMQTDIHALSIQTSD